MRKDTQFWITTAVATIGTIVAIVAVVDPMISRQRVALPPVSASSILQEDTVRFSETMGPCTDTQNKASVRCSWKQWSFTPKSAHSTFDFKIAVDIDFMFALNAPGTNGCVTNNPTMWDSGGIIFECEDGPHEVNNDAWPMEAENKTSPISHRLIAKTSCDASGSPVTVSLTAQPGGCVSMMSEKGILHYRETIR